MFIRIAASGVLAVLVTLATAADVSVQPGPSDLYRGSERVSSHARVEECIDAAIKGGQGDYSCSTMSQVAVQSSGSAGACGVSDIGGWTVPVPSPLDTTTIPAKDKAQPGTRLYYISAQSGDDATGVIYFWNGTHVVDAAGATYGTDAMNPQGIKPFRRWAWVGPRRSTTADIGTKGWIGDAWPTFRGGFPDWWLFKRGDTFDLREDFASFDNEVGQPGTNVYSSLNIPGGRSATERAVVGAWGDLCKARPRFIHPKYGFVNRAARDGAFNFQHSLYQSLHWDAHDRPSGVIINSSFNSMTAASVDNVIEDVWIDGGGLGIGDDNAGQFLLRRVLITDAFQVDNSSHAQGLYYEGTRTGWLRVEDSILMRNGFVYGDPSKTPWPPKAPQIWDIYSRNQYINGELDPFKSGLFDSVSMMGASGDQWRPGGRIQRNFFYNGYVDIGARGGYPDEQGPTAEVLNNVLQKFVGAGTPDNRGQPGWGFTLSAGTGYAYLAGNIVTAAQSPSTTYGIQISPINQDCYAPPKYPTRGNKVVRNIIDTGTASAALRVTDGTTNSCFVGVLMSPGVTGNHMSDNVLTNDKMKESEYLPVGNAPATTDTVYSGNRMFATRAAAAAALGWPDPNRTLKTYMVSQGVDVKSADGFPEYFDRASQMRRGKWDPRWIARPIIDHVRAGFGLSRAADAHK